MSTAQDDPLVAAILDESFGDEPVTHYPDGLPDHLLPSEEEEKEMMDALNRDLEWLRNFAEEILNGKA